MGIDQQAKRSLFEALRNQDKKNSGVGIGLSNAKSLVRALKGKIKVESKQGRGTIVSFSVETLPYKEQLD